MRSIRASCFFIVALFSYQISFAQLCGSVLGQHKGPAQKMSSYSFLNSNHDYEMLDEYIPYTNLYVSTDVLNIRDAPNIGNVVGQVFLETELQIFSRKGDWVAITNGSTNPKIHNPIGWVHINYLSTRHNLRLKLNEKHYNAKFSRNNIAQTNCPINDMIEHLEEIKYASKCHWYAKYYLRGTKHANLYKTLLRNAVQKDRHKKAYKKINSNCFY